MKTTINKQDCLTGAERLLPDEHEAPSLPTVPWRDLQLDTAPSCIPNACAWSPQAWSPQAWSPQAWSPQAWSPRVPTVSSRCIYHSQLQCCSVLPIERLGPLITGGSTVSHLCSPMVPRASRPTQLRIDGLRVCESLHRCPNISPLLRRDPNPTHRAAQTLDLVSSRLHQ
ncbi:hypothetical protein BKA56DRAFT_162720 [Ilyonectria sp. MPI-CAGE-AT-0026]|nr:hypothetical protein BKA56DRAFT_162720 [Ilyonectria sp. MPI-CAGE-AT-0026]